MQTRLLTTSLALTTRTGTRCPEANVAPKSLSPPAGEAAINLYLHERLSSLCVCRQHILAGAVSVLSGQQGLSSRAAADALAAVAVLEGRDSSAALQAFLSARQQWVQQQLQQAAQGVAGEAPGGVLAALAQTVQSCVAQVRPAWEQVAFEKCWHGLDRPRTGLDAHRV
jgi:hypothetical protein